MRPESLGWESGHGFPEDPGDFNVQQVCDSLRWKTGPLLISEAERYLQPIFYLPFGLILLKKMKKREREKKKLQRAQARESKMRKVVRIREGIKEKGVMGGNLGREKRKGRTSQGFVVKGCFCLLS